MKRIGRAALQGAAATAAFLVLAVGAAHSSPRVCRQLEAELASAGSTGGGARRYERAIAGQRDQLAIAHSRARQAGCGFGIFSPRSCKPMNDQIDRMEGNLEALERKRAQMGDDSPHRSRSAILAALGANGCRDQAVAERTPPPDDDTGNVEIDSDLFARLFGRDAAPQEPADESGGPANVTRILNPNGETDVYGPQGEFSTMCVRTCDGYFFPVSPSSSAADFERDEKNCEATCPGTEVQLYYRPADSEDTDTMMSMASGEPYMSLPTAYIYKDASKPRVQACGCRGAMVDPDFSIVGGEPADTTVPAEPVIPTPAGRPDPALDPESLANAEGKLDLETIRRILKPKPVAAPMLPPGERRVRVVGPEFLPDPEGAIDLKAPGQRKVQ